MNNINALAVHLLSKAGNYVTYGEHLDFSVDDLITQVKTEIEITTYEFETLTIDEAKLCGFRKWSDDSPNLYLIPTWLYNFLPSGLKVESINGEKFTIDKPSDLDNDSRFGCLAYGVNFKID